jgi:hypothetical protein
MGVYQMAIEKIRSPSDKPPNLMPPFVVTKFFSINVTLVTANFQSPQGWRLKKLKNSVFSVATGYGD